jgi:class 3 adenylate cyclase
VTVLFADLGGSMALSGSIGLEEWWSMIATLFELMSEAVEQCGGWVGAFTGDGINAVFEADGGAEEHARRACQAALSIRDAMQEPAAALRRERRLELTVRVGINSGEVVTGTVGGPCGRYFTACGYTVALAKRMEALATPDRIYLTEHSAALIGPSLLLQDLGVFEVKGAPRPVGVYELLARGR